jgi:hypothetical protein
MFSCGKKASESEPKNLDQIISNEDQGYALPPDNFQRSVALDYEVDSLYEEMTVNPNGNNKVLGDSIFYLFLSPENQIELRFYVDVKIKNISYIDFRENYKGIDIKSFEKDILKNMNFKKVKNFFRKLTYGISNWESPEQDMLNKVFLLESEAINGHYKSNMKLIIWVECLDDFSFVSEKSYSCGQGKLIFNYKLLDYQLQKGV